MKARQAGRRLEKSDRAATHVLNDDRDTWPVRLAGAVSEIGDQPQMRLLCAATVVIGLVRRDARLAKTGLRMLAAHTLATWGKGAVKAVVDRTRPDSEGEGYRFGPGDSDAHAQNSFPSGHSAGAVAVAHAFGRAYPEHAGKALGAAAAIAAVQIPRGTHFIGDVLAGSDRALEHAIMTAPAFRDPELLAKLDAGAGRVLHG